MKKVIFYTILAIFFSGCISPNIADYEKKEFMAINLKTNQKLEFGEFINELNKYDIVLLGEHHDDFLHKFLTLKIANELAKFGDLSVALEMLESSKQSCINKAKQNKAKISQNEIKNALCWEKWKYKDYKYLIENLFYSQIEILGANLNKDEISTIMKGAQPLKGDKSTTKNVKEAIKKVISESHKTDDNEILEVLSTAQQYKDRRMADILINSKNKVILLAGSYHIDKDMGIPLHIDDFNSYKKINKKAVVIFLGDKNYINADYFIKEK